MLEEVLSQLSSMPMFSIYLVLFLFSFIENIFPPSPSDVVVVVGASLIASTKMDFIPVLLITSIGSAMGFVLMYFVGKFFGEKVIRTGKLKFVSKQAMQNVDSWFNKYGYKLIAANRFLPGTRSIISFFSGVHELHLLKTFLLAALSAFLWNALIIYLGMEVGHNVELIDYYLNTYSSVILAITAVAALIFGVRFFIKKKNKDN